MGQINYNDVAIQSNVGFTVTETKEAYTVKPTFTQYPNEIFDTLSSEGLPLTAYLSPAEEKVLNRCIRMANGYHRAKFRMSLSEMAELTGLSKTGVVNCVNSLGETKLISYSASNGVGSWSLALDKLESALEYFVSKHRTTQLYSNKKKVRTTELANRTTELYDNGQTVQLSGTPSIKENSLNKINKITTKATKNVALENEEILSQLQNEVSEVINPLPIQEKPITSQAIQANGNTAKAKTQTPPPVSPAPPVDPLVLAYCEALTLNPNEDTAKKEAETFVKKLLVNYPHVTPLELKDNITHAVHVQSLKTGQIVKNWLKLSNDIALANTSEIRGIVASLKVVYGVSEMSHEKEWQFVEIAGQIKTMRITANEVARFKDIWPQGFMLPKLENFISSLTQNMSKIKQGETNNGHTASNAGCGVGKVSQSILDRITSKSI